MLPGNIDTLDAGFGNGAMSYAAYSMGNRVLGISNQQREVQTTTQLFDFLNIPRSAIELRCMNLYDLKDLNRTFDQIICSETLEHITRDQEMVKTFASLLQPGGRLILCCPYALHPQHALGRTNEPENGYHVRDGYTLDSYKQLLTSADMTVTQQLGLGSPLLCATDRVERWSRNNLGALISLPVFLLMLPFAWFDYTNPAVPFSLAVVAEKIKG